MSGLGLLNERVRAISHRIANAMEPASIIRIKHLLQRISLFLRESKLSVGSNNIFRHGSFALNFDQRTSSRPTVWLERNLRAAAHAFCG